MNETFRQELIEILVREAYVEREVTLSSGRKSDYYLDCRPAMFLPRAMFLAGELMLALVREAGVEQVGGMAVAAIPVTAAIIAAAYRNGVDLRGFFVRKDVKSHGLQKRIEGAFKPGLKTAVLDDTVTTGGSTLDALAAVREAGGIVTAALALVDRDEGGADAFRREGVPYRWAITGSEIRTAARVRP